MIKNIIVVFGLTGLLGIVHAQHQLTNFGNLKFHQGSSVSFFGDFRNTGTFTDTANVVNFIGSSNQVISGTSPISFNHCAINNSAGVSLQRNIAVKNLLDLTLGSLVLNTNTVSIINGSTTAINRTTGNIVSEQTDNSGKLEWMIGNNNGSHIYPFATGAGQYIPFTLNLTAGDIGTVSLATYPTTTTNLPFPSNPDVVTHVNNALGVDNSANTVDRFWQIGKTGASGTATITFTATTIEVGGIANLSAFRWNSAALGWETPPGVQTNTASSVTVQDVTNFSPWTLAGNNSPLPVELLDFTAALNNKRQVDLDWRTVAEINNDYFTIEKTSDGTHFEEVGIVDGAGNSNQTLNYHLLDLNPYQGISYYRLKQTDYDGEVKYTDLRTIHIGETANVSWNVYPNPAQGEFMVSVSGLKNTEVSLNIFDLTGKLFYTRIIHIETDQQIISVNDLQVLSSGIYIVQMMADQPVFSTKLVIK
jgi:hypothetical protein